MARAIAFAAQIRPVGSVHELLRSAIVYGCALALICAGPAFPELGL
jgi:hypothetical protein